MVVVLVIFAIKLQGGRLEYFEQRTLGSYQVQDRNFHHTLIEVCSLILNDLHGNNLLGFQVLALDNLTKCPLAQHVEDKVTIPYRDINTDGLKTSARESVERTHL